MVNYPMKDNTLRYLGLMAERVTETLNKPNTELVEAAIQVNEAPYLGEMIMDDKGMIQCIRLDKLFSDSQQKYLMAGVKGSNVTGSN